MDIYVKYIAIVMVLKAIGLGRILLVILLRLLYPKASIVEVESFVKNTKTKFKFPKVWK